MQIGTVIDVGNTLTYTASQLGASATYTLRVAAYDNATPANTSAFCAPVPGTTSPGADTQPPSVPTNVRVTGATTSSISWAWDASTDNISVAGYRVALYSATDVQIGAVVDVGSLLSYTASGLSANATYKLRVAAYDNATTANVSAFSAAVAGATSPAVDAQPPSVPTGLRVRSVQQISIAWAWTASTDGGGGVVAGYRIALYDANDVPIGNIVDVGNVVTYTTEGLTAETMYKLRVAAYDNAVPANVSVFCAPVTGTTKKPPPGKR
ncbi:MAG: fibronectin type III domain-containing protein [Bacteroidota bacterium]